MTLKTDAWVVHRGEGKNPGKAELKFEKFEIPDLGPEHVYARPLYGCWEGNMGHILDRKPLDVAAQRDEDRVVMGNAGVVEIIEVGDDVTTVKKGDIAVLFCNGGWDEFGYPEWIFGYDAKDTIGMLAKTTRLHQKQVIRIPDKAPTDARLAQWAGFSLRYPTAWSNWRLAYGTYRLMLDDNEYPTPTVWGWGGGVTLAQLDLAHRAGCNAVQISSSGARRALAENLGIGVVDRSEFKDLYFDERRYRKDEEYTAKYLAAENVFKDIVKERTDGGGVNIFIDYIGGPVSRATILATSRQSVVTTAGWKAGMRVSNIRAIECINRRQHIHTHYARYSEGIQAVNYAANNDWLPEVDPKIYNYEDVPTLAEDYAKGDFVYYPIFKVNA